MNKIISPAQLPNGCYNDNKHNGCFDVLLRRNKLDSNNICVYIKNASSNGCRWQEIEHICIDMNGNLYQMCGCRDKPVYISFDNFINTSDVFDDAQIDAVLSHLSFYSNMHSLECSNDIQMYNNNRHGYYTFQIHRPIIGLINYLIESTNNKKSNI